MYRNRWEHLYVHIIQDFKYIRSDFAYSGSRVQGVRMWICYGNVNENRFMALFSKNSTSPGHFVDCCHGYVILYHCHFFYFIFHVYILKMHDTEANMRLCITFDIHSSTSKCEYKSRKVIRYRCCAQTKSSDLLTPLRLHRIKLFEIVMTQTILHRSFFFLRWLQNKTKKKQQYVPTHGQRIKLLNSETKDKLTQTLRLQFV